MKLLEENVGEILQGFNTQLFGKDPKTGNKSKTKQMQLYQIQKLLYKKKETINRIKRHSVEQVKIFANHISDKELIS